MNNYCIIMAGGVGSRFWPYSRNSRPKQFRDFFGTGRSLLQLTVDRLHGLVPIENIIVATNAAYRDLVLEQIPEILPENILLEPCRRNTAPCIAYAAAHIMAKTSDADILVAASDHLITDRTAFRKTLETALSFVNDHQDIVTLGMMPTRPETGYGYIQLANAQKPLGVNGDNIYSVRQFREKPDRETARQYLESGDYLWNSGMFVFNLQTIVAAFKTHLPSVWRVFENGSDVMGTDKEQIYIQEHFAGCENISIDYGIMEKAQNVMVMPSDFGWSDVGTWGSLYELQTDKDDNGNVTLNADANFYDSHRNIVTLENGKLAVIEGLDDYIVAESDGVLLIFGNVTLDSPAKNHTPGRFRLTAIQKIRTPRRKFGMRSCHPKRR